MKITWFGRNGTGRFGFLAEPGAYDAIPPVNELLVDRDMALISDDVLALSGFLTFAPYCSGVVSLPRKISPELAAAMQRFAQPDWLQVSPVEFEPRRAPQGHGFAFVSSSADLGFKLPNSWGRPRNVAISVLDSSEWAGSLVAMDRILIASNASVFARFGPDALSLLPFVSVALLYLESYRCTTVVVPDDAIADEAVWERLVDLVTACKLALVRESEAHEILGSMTPSGG